MIRYFPPVSCFEGHSPISRIISLWCMSLWCIWQQTDIIFADIAWRLRSECADVHAGQDHHCPSAIMIYTAIYKYYVCRYCMETLIEVHGYAFCHCPYACKSSWHSLWHTYILFANIGASVQHRHCLYVIMIYTAIYRYYICGYCMETLMEKHGCTFWSGSSLSIWTYAIVIDIQIYYICICRYWRFWSKRADAHVVRMDTVRMHVCHHDTLWHTDILFANIGYSDRSAPKHMVRNPKHHEC